MRLKDGFILREVAGTYVVVAIGGEAKKLNAMITLNETGAFLWEKLSAGSDEAGLLEAMLDEYDIDEATAKNDIAKFIETVKAEDLLCK